MYPRWSITIAVVSACLVCPTIHANWNIIFTNNTYLIQAGQLERQISLHEGGFGTRAILVDGVNVLAEKNQELSVRFYRADPDQKPAGLQPGQGGEMITEASFNQSATEIFNLRAASKEKEPRWIELPEVRLTDRTSALIATAFQISHPAEQVTRLAITTSGAKNGPLQDVTLRIIYEIYDGHHAIRKWVEFLNGGRHWLKLSHLIIDDIAIARNYQPAIPLTPPERGAASSVLALSNADQSRGLIVCSEVPSALRHLDHNGAAGYAADLFEWVLGPGETFVSEPVFQYAFAGSVWKTASGNSTQQAKLADEDGEPVSIDLVPPLTLEEIDSLQKRVGQPLPEELRTLLTFCSGIDGGSLDGIDFTGSRMSFAQEEIFPSGLPIAADGFGNFWVLDITPQTTRVAPVFFACHDAPVILYQSADVATFLAEVFRMSVPPHKSLVDDVHEDRLFDVWRKNPGVIDQPTASASSNPTLRSFAAGLPEHFQIVDLRNVDPGMGFSWGRFGPRTEVRRHGYERVFGYAKPAGRGFFAKLFGR